MASYTVAATSPTSAEIRLSGVTMGESLRVYLRLSPAGSPAIYDFMFTYEGTNVVTLNNLTPETSYTVNVGTGTAPTTWWGGQTFTTPAEKTLPAAWSWTASNGSASDAQTQAAYSAVANGGEAAAFSYLVWNDMVDKAAEMQSYVGGAWNSDYASKNATKMSSSDKTMTAARFNSLVHNIDLYYSAALPTVNPGDAVMGLYFIVIAQRINEWRSAAKA